MTGGGLTSAPPSEGVLPRALPPELVTFRIETWGCQMNEHDSERMAGVLRSLGLAPARSEGDADVILLNTCSVREKAAQKVFTRLGQLRRHKARRPHVILGVCGCVAQQEQERIFARAPFVDLVMGPRRIAALPELIAASRRKGRAMGLFDPHESLVPEPGAVSRVSRTRAYVTVMEGCNKNCAFCIVPVTRGREACRPPASILNEVRACVSQGLVEVQLLGQNVNAWRHGGQETWDFTRLLASVARSPGVRRVRFTTSHPLHFKSSIVEAMASHATICRSLHLPAQSGSDRVLKMMRRGYTRAEYLERVRRLRASVEDVALSTDLIVGFPGETADDFARTMELVREVGFDSIFSFLYSPRPGTTASSMPDDVELPVKKERLHRLQEFQEGIQRARNLAYVGRLVEVLVEGPASRPGGQLCGRTSQNHVVNFEGGPELVGRLVTVRITRAAAHSLAGSLDITLTSWASRDIDRST